MNIEDMLRTIYSESQSLPREKGEDKIKNKATEVWDEIRNESPAEDWSGKHAMSLEDFLAEAGAVNKEDIGVSVQGTLDSLTPDGFAMDSAIVAQNSHIPDVQFTATPSMQTGVGVGSGAEYLNGIAAVNGGRGKRRASVVELPLDNITLQKQKRMIKNRESAARSRQRKQAYTTEMESLVTQLEADNARLLEEEAKLNRKRYKQLMENLIPVIEQRRPARVVLRRVRSLQW